MNSARILSLIVLMLLMSSCRKFLCDDVVKTSVASPDKHLVLTSVRNNCGATTRETTAVVLHRPDQDYRDTEAAVFVVYGDPELSIAWIDNRDFQITCESCVKRDIFKMLLVWGDNGIHFQLPRAPELVRLLIGP